MSRLSFAPIIRMTLNFCFCIVLLNVAVTSFSAAAQEGTRGSPVSVSFQDGLLAVDAKDARLAVVLDQIAETAKLTIRLRGSGDMLVNVRSAPRSIEKTILGMAKGISAVFLYGTDETGTRKLTGINVLSPAEDSSITLFGFADHADAPTSVAHQEFFEAMAHIDPHQLSNVTDIDRLVQILQFDPDPASRSAAAELLGNVTAELYSVTSPMLNRALDDPHPSVRLAAMESLGTVQTDEFVDGITFALSDNDPVIRLAALSGISSLDRKDGLEIARQALEDRDASIRVAAIEELSRMEGAEVANTILFAAHDEEPMVRRAVDMALIQRYESLMDEPVFNENPEMDSKATWVDDGEPDMHEIPEHPPKGGE